MILRLLMFGLLSLALLGFGVVAWVSTHPHTIAAAAEQAASERVTVLVLAHEVRGGNLLRSDDLAARELPRGELPADAIADAPEQRRALAGGMLRRGLGPGDVLRNADVMRPGDHGFLAAVLQPGLRAVTIGVDLVSGTAGLIWPGDRVDVVMTQVVDDPALPPGRRVGAEVVLQNVRVIAIDQALVQGTQPEGALSGMQSPSQRTVTLEVTSEQVERVQVATRIGHLSLAVRSAEQPSAPAPAAAPVWGTDVSSVLAAAPVAKAQTNVLHLFQGAAESKEFRF